MFRWLKFSVAWIFYGKYRCFKIIIKAQTKSEVLDFKNNMYLVKFKFLPNHWVTKDFINMCDKEIYFIAEADKDL